MSQSTDILVIGAGLVGTSLAAALQGQGLKIQILEHHLPAVVTKTHRDSRPIALSQGSQQILQTLGLWEALAKNACPIHTVHVSHQGALGRMQFQAQEFSIPALGYVTAYADLQQILYQRAATQNNIIFTAIHKITSIHCNTTGATVTAQTGHGKQIFHAALLVATDGTHSTVRELLNIETTEKNVDDVAQTALLTLHRDHQHIAYERFTQDGTLALLPLSDNKKYRLVWTLTKTQADQLMQWSDAQMITYIQDTFYNRLNTIDSIIRDQQYPIKTMIAQEQIRPGLVLLGNAAQTIYPLAAQGFNLALRDVAVLSEVLIDALSKMQSLRDFDVLQNYANWRATDQQRTIRLTGRISEIFGLQWPFINRVRGLGLLAADLLLPLKKRMALQMMGLAGRVPKLARGVMLTNGK